MDEEEIITNVAYDETNKMNDDIAESNDLTLQKRLAKLILDIKYESGMVQSTVDMLLCRFRLFFNEGVHLYNEAVSNNVNN
jgi:hypothetical protein